MNNLKEKTISGVIWNAIGRFSTQGMSFVFTMLIARMLMPEDYGVVAMLGIFMAIAGTFIDSGFANALIRKPDRTETDMATVFYFNIAVALFFYIVLWFAAPYIAEFYEQPLLLPITRIVALNFVIGSFGSVAGLQFTFRLDFKTPAKLGVVNCIFNGTLTLFLAYKGYGVWALVWSGIVGNIFNVLLLYIVVRWKPLWTFSWKSFREMFSYGSKLLASALLDTTYNNIYPIVIGKIYSAATLGVYGRASNLAQFPSSNITSILQSVTFPVLSTIQNEDNRLVDAYRRFITMSAFVVFPLMVGLAAVADPFIRLTLTDKWEGAIYLLQIICFALMWYPVHAINLNVLQVKGRSDYFLKLEVIKKVQGILILCITVPMGIVAMCYGKVIGTFIALIWNTYYSKRIIGYGYFQQMRDLLPILFHAFVMGLLAWGTVQLMPNLWLQLIGGILVGGTYYIIGAYLLKFRELDEIISIIKSRKPHLTSPVGKTD